ncbi:MAG: P-loop NTPase [Gammaproteobacteria bacterium]
MRQQLTIIPIASGKGGVGKSLLSANLAIALAKMGHATIVADLDLGSPDLHSFLGSAEACGGIAEFIHTRGAKLSDYLQTTPWKNLKLLSGDSQRPFAANLAYQQKLKLIRQLSQLPARYLILDLGAGNSYNIVDFFRTTTHGLLVTTPEPTATRNISAFLNQLAHRSLDHALRSQPASRRLLRELQATGQDQGQPLTMGRICRQLADMEPQAAGIVGQACMRYQPRLILNMGSHPDDLDALDNTAQLAAERCSLHCEPYGFIFDDSTVRESIRAGIPLLEYAEDATATQCIVQLAQHIVHLWDKTLEEPSLTLRNHTRKFYEYLQRDAHQSHARFIPGTLRHFFPGLFNY